MNRRRFFSRSIPTVVSAASLSTPTLLAATAPGSKERIINAIDFGAIGDGKVDDTKALQKAFAALQNEGVLYLPMGKYRVTSTIVLPPRSNVRVLGASISASQIIADRPVQDLLRVESPFSSSALEHFGLDARGMASTALRVVGGGHCVLDHLDVKSPKEIGIHCGSEKFGINAGVECIIRNSRVTGMRQIKPTDLTSRLGIWVVHWTDGEYRDLIIKGFTDTGMELWTGSSRVHMVHIYRAPVNRYRTGIRIHARSTYVSMCQFDNPADVGIEVLGTRVIIGTNFFQWDHQVYGRGPVLPIDGVRIGSREKQASKVSIFGNGFVSNIPDKPEFAGTKITAVRTINGSEVEIANNVYDGVASPMLKSAGV